MGDARVEASTEPGHPRPRQSRWRTSTSSPAACRHMFAEMPRVISVIQPSGKFRVAGLTRRSVERVATQSFIAGTSRPRDALKSLLDGCPLLTSLVFMCCSSLRLCVGLVDYCHQDIVYVGVMNSGRLQHPHIRVLRLPKGAGGCVTCYGFGQWSVLRVTVFWELFRSCVTLCYVLHLQLLWCVTLDGVDALSRGRGHSVRSQRPIRWPIPSWPYHLSSSPPQPSPAQLNLSCLGRPIPTAGLAA